MRLHAYQFIAILALLAFQACSTPNQFSFSLGSALETAAPDGEVINPCFDANGNLDIDCDGNPETTVDPISLPPEPDPDPTVVRDDSGSCVLSTNFAFIAVSGTQTYSYNTLNGAEDLWIRISSNGNTATVDLNNIAGVKRIFIQHTGNTNRVIVREVDLQYGICNEISGGSNSEFFASTVSAPVVDLLSGNGNNNNLDIDFEPGDILNYALSGNSNCLSAEPGTLTYTITGSGDTFNADGTDCF